MSNIEKTMSAPNRGETETLAAEISLSRIAFEAASRFVAQKEEEDSKKRPAIVDDEERK
jgi:hypothetical protein